MKGVFRSITLAALLAAAGCNELAVIRTNPTGAEIYCNGERIGTSPCNAPLPESEGGMIGMSVIEARKTGYLPEYYYLSGKPSDEDAGHIQTYSLSKPVITIELTKLPDNAKPTDVPDVLKANKSEDSNSDSMTVMPGAYQNRAAIEVRIVRVRDGRVLGQICRYETVDNINAVAQSIVGELCDYLPSTEEKPEIRVLTLRNRRHSDFGKKLSTDLTEELMRETCFSGGYPKVQTMDLRGIIEEDKLDTQAMFKKIKRKGLLDGVDYVLMGGVAESIKP